MSNTKHTPTPWTLDAYKDVIGADDVTVASVYCTVQGGVDMDDLNAAFIVRAVNSHEQLVTALNRAVRAIENLGHCEGGLSGRDELEKACDQMTDALAAAEA